MYKIGSRTATIKTQFEGVHNYPDAPDEVSYLRYPHRHIFYVTVELDVFSDDREIEFIMLKHKLNQWLNTQKNSVGVIELGTTSCEQMGERIIRCLAAVVEGQKERELVVAVSEDNENGANVYGSISAE